MALVEAVRDRARALRRARLSCRAVRCGADQACNRGQTSSRPACPLTADFGTTWNVVGHTLPPFFMPMTDVDSAGGGLGPLWPEKLPPAMPPSALRALRSPVGLPTVKAYGCKRAAPCDKHKQSTTLTDETTNEHDCQLLARRYSCELPLHHLLHAEAKSSQTGLGNTSTKLACTSPFVRTRWS
jgi:hypothetical protein